MNPLLPSFLNAPVNTAVGSQGPGHSQATSSREFKLALQQQLSSHDKTALSASTQAAAFENPIPGGTSDGVLRRFVNFSLASDSTQAAVAMDEARTYTVEVILDADQQLAALNLSSLGIAALDDATRSALTAALTNPLELQKLVQAALTSENAGTHSGLVDLEIQSSETAGISQDALVFASARDFTNGIELAEIKQNSNGGQFVHAQLLTSASSATGAAMLGSEFSASLNANSTLLQGAPTQTNALAFSYGNATLANLASGNAENINVKNLATNAFMTSTEVNSGVNPDVVKTETKTTELLLQTTELANKFKFKGEPGLGDTLTLEKSAVALRENLLLVSGQVDKGSADSSLHSLLTSQQHFNLNQGAENARMQMPVNISFGRPEWAAQVAERAAMMSLQKLQSAELQLDPPELGSLHVKVSVNADQQASVTFISPHASVRDALDQSIARLRELLEQQGVDLVDVNVSDQQQRESDQEEAEASTETVDALNNEDSSATVIETVSHYGVDFYA